MSESQLATQGIAPVTRLGDLSQVREDDVIDLRHLFVTWLIWLWLPILLAGIGAYFGYQDLKAYQPQSVASMIVLPTSAGATQQSSGGRVESLAAQFGLQLGPAQSTVSLFYRLQVLLGSTVLAEQLQARYGMMQRIYASAWDSATESWRRPTGEAFERDQRWRAFMRQNLWTPPSIESLSRYLKGKVVIEPIEGGAFQRISVIDSDPQFALWLLQVTYTEADEFLREEDRRNVAEREAYINRELAVATNVQVQEALRGMLSTELARRVTLSGALPYAASIAEPARVSDQKTEPSARLLFGIPMAAGGALGFFVITLIAVMRRERRR